jgi:Mut7-C RNAse domain
MNRMAAFRWSDNERYWKGFLVDLCVQEITPILHQMGYRARVTEEKQDAETVLEAWEEDRTVVTVNENHFVRDTLIHQKRDSGKTNCNGAWGLLILSDHAGKRERWLPTLKAGVPAGKEVIPWRAIAYANLCVSLHADGTISLRRLRRCVHCETEAPITEDWFQELPLLN